MVELADTRDLKSLAERHTGSTPVSGTRSRRIRIRTSCFLYSENHTLGVWFKKGSPVRQTKKLLFDILSGTASHAK